jgi:hypothetical protein
VYTVTVALLPAFNFTNLELRSRIVRLGLLSSRNNLENNEGQAFENILIFLKVFLHKCINISIINCSG